MNDDKRSVSLVKLLVPEVVHICTGASSSIHEEDKLKSARSSIKQCIFDKSTNVSKGNIESEEIRNVSIKSGKGLINPPFNPSNASCIDEQSFISFEESSDKLQDESITSLEDFDLKEALISIRVENDDKNDKNVSSFPKILMEMLNEEYSDFIRWRPHGKSFEILNLNKLITDVLPLFFKNSKYASFKRKLYRWGFRKITLGEDRNSYYNQNFLRHNDGIVSKMYCHYSPKELRLKRAKKNIRKSSIMQLFNNENDDSPFVRSEENCTSTGGQSQTQVSGVQSGLPNPPANQIVSNFNLCMPLQHNQQHGLYVPNPPLMVSPPIVSLIPLSHQLYPLTQITPAHHLIQMQSSFLNALQAHQNALQAHQNAFQAHQNEIQAHQNSELEK